MTPPLPLPVKGSGIFFIASHSYMDFMKWPALRMAPLSAAFHTSPYPTPIGVGQNLSGRRHLMKTYDAFNVENDNFPLLDGEFDASAEMNLDLLDVAAASEWHSYEEDAE
jgi:hypothetical protein